MSAPQPWATRLVRWHCDYFSVGMEGEMDPELLQGHLVSQCLPPARVHHLSHWWINAPCWKSTSVGKGLQCKNKSGPVCSIVCGCFEHGASPRMDPKSASYCLAGSAMCKLLFAGIPLCLSRPALKYIQLIYYHTCCPQGVFQNDLSLTQHYYHSLPSPFQSYPFPAFFPSEFKGVEEAEFNH